MIEDDIVQVLIAPEEFYPGNFDSAKRANAFLLCLCQDAAEEITILQNKAKDAINALHYLMQQFDFETWQCPICGHAEDTATMDSAEWLRDWLKTHNAPHEGPGGFSPGPLDAVVGGRRSTGTDFKQGEHDDRD